MSRVPESSISRLLTHSDRYDCALITAFRRYRDCGSVQEYTPTENAQRNASLHVKLIAGIYQHASIGGTYAKVNEVIRDRFFFVVNSGWGKSNTFYRFMQRMKRFGEEFEQDAVLVIPKGSMCFDVSRPHIPETEHSKRRGRAFFIRTIDDPGNWMMDQDLMKFPVDETLLGRTVGDFLNIVNGRPLQVQSNSENEDHDEVEVLAVHYLPGNLSSLALASRYGRKPWREADVNWLRGSKPPEDCTKIFR